MPDILLASAGEDLRLWAMPILSLYSVKNGTNANLTSCSCSPNGQFVAYAHEGGGLNVASLQDDGQEIVKIPTPCEQSSVAFNGNSRYLVSSGVDHVVYIWDIKSKTAKRTYKDHTHPVTASIFNYNDNIIASSSDHGDILLTNVQSGISSESFSTGDKQAIRSLRYSYFVRSLLASIDDTGAVSLWDTKEKKLIKSFTEHKGPGTELSFSPLNDMLLCSCGLDKRIIFYDVTGKKMVKTINTEGPVTCCEFMHDGCTVAAGTASGRLYLFDLRQGSTPVKVVSGHKTSVRSVSFQLIPKESKSPHRVADDNNSLGRVESVSQKGTLSEGKMATIQLPLERSTPGTQINSDIANNQAQSSSNNQPQSTSDIGLNLTQNMSSLMGQRENSSMTLNSMLNFNQVATPNKGTKLNSDDIFSPIPIDLNTRKAVVSRQRSSPKMNTAAPGVSMTSEETRPTYLRSKSSFSKLSSVAKSTDDLTFIQKKSKDKDGDKDSIDGGKRGLLGFKSPFKKKHVKYSDESETSSIDSFSLDQNRKSPLAGRRGKKEQASDRSIDSFTIIKQISNDSEQFSPVSKFDPNQLVTDVQQSLAMQVGTSEKNLATEKSANISSFQIELIKGMIDDAMEESRSAVHDAIVNLQVEMLRQMEIQKEQIRQMIQHYSVNENLVSEVNKLRAENEKLRLKY